MARLEVEIGGNASGLGKAGTQALGILENLQNVANGLKLELFKADDVVTLNAIGNTLTNVTGQIKAYTDEAIKGSRAFQLQQTESTLSSLATKLSVLSGNAQIFGTSISNQQLQVKAYETAISKLLANGLSPMDAQVTNLKGRLDALNASLLTQQTAANVASAAATKTAADAAKLANIYNTLNTSLRSLNGVSQVFGDSLANQQSQVKAYENAISKLIGNGIAPADARIKSLKAEIDKLNASMSSQATDTLRAGFQATGALVPDLEAKIARLRRALSGATDEASIGRYNKRLVEAQKEMDRLRTVGLSAADAAKRLGGGFNTVGLEFGRIIQDAPFAANNFGSIGNNITRLAEVIPGYVTQQRAIITANGGVATTGALVKGSLLGLISGFGGVTLAISLVVSAFTFYQQSQQKAAREQEKLKKANEDLEASLKGVEAVTLRGTKNAQAEIVQLQQWYGAARNLNLPMEERFRVAKKLQEQWPKTFANLSEEEIAAGKAGNAYKMLAQNILEAAKAAAGMDRIAKNSEKVLDEQFKQNKALQDERKIREQLAKLPAAPQRRAFGSAGSGAANAITPDEKARLDLNSKLAETIKRQNEAQKRKTEYTYENLQIEKLLTKQTEATGSASSLIGEDKIIKPKKEKTLRDTITPRVEKTTDTADLAGLVGNDAEVEKIRQRYEKLYDDIATAANKKGADISKLGSLRAEAEANEAREITQIIVAERTRVADEIQRIQNESGVKATQNRERELAQIEAWYDKEVIKAEGNAAILTTIAEGKQARIDAVSDKYEQKRLDAQQKISEQIQTLADKEFRINDRNTAKGTEAIERELDKRLRAVGVYFDKLRKAYANDPMAQLALGAAQGVIEADIKTGARKADDAGLGAELSRSVAKFGSDMFRTLSTINERADQSFGSIISDLGKNLNTAITDVFMDKFRKKLEQTLSSAFDKMDKGTQKLVGGLALAGGLVSGATKKTSTLGQAAGGALSGAATGAVLGTAIAPGIGTAIGAVVGGIAGALGGIFGSSKARKQEELEKKQLAESEKQTKLLERQNALTYTSSIIGRMTTQGIVSGVEVNEFGQLTAKIVGQDFLLMLDRASRSRQRGT